MFVRTLVMVAGDFLSMVWLIDSSWLEFCLFITDCGLSMGETMSIKKTKYKKWDREKRRRLAEIFPSMFTYCATLSHNTTDLTSTRIQFHFPSSVHHCECYVCCELFYHDPPPSQAMSQYKIVNLPVKPSSLVTVKGKKIFLKTYMIIFSGPIGLLLNLKL